MRTVLPADWGEVLLGEFTKTTLTEKKNLKKSIWNIMQNICIKRRLEEIG